MGKKAQGCKPTRLFLFNFAAALCKYFKYSLILLGNVGGEKKVVHGSTTSLCVFLSENLSMKLILVL